MNQYPFSDEVLRLNKRKLLELSGNSEQLKTKKQKYGAVRTYSELCQRTFDSKAEARRGEELGMWQEGGIISDLRYQVIFKLCATPKITVKIDFAYLENGTRVFEDVKGVLTRDSRTRYAWLKEKHGIEVKLVK